jgi:ribose 5-phosphate isomerase A
MNLKYEAALAALGEITSGMKLGLGTGSTAEELVKLLAAALQRGELHDVRCTSTSNATETLARSLGIPMATLDELFPLDLTIDGADEIDASLRLIKGRGAALLREKIVEQASKRFVVIADESKVVERLGVGLLPVEVTPFAVKVITAALAEMDCAPQLRLREGSPLVTDEGNRIIDVTIPADRDIADVVDEIRQHAGVVETGFFPNEATLAIIATPSGIRRMPA